MRLGFIMLCHTALHRAAQVARYWAAAGCPVVIHVDAKVRPAAYDQLVADLADLDHVRFSPRYRCEWGTWGLVAATQDAAALLLRDFPAVQHVYLASGSCLPLRPVAELADYLAARPRTDFIESVTTAEVGWTIGGLSAERFTLRFPFSWRRRRRLFDGYVALQRWLKLRRRIPAGLTPHLGSQWWCLTRTTLTAILDDPARARIDRYFRRVWIPDESYFQTMVRRHSTTVESRSLTLTKFDYQGKPHTFYDDHRQLLRRSDCFVARKIWPQAHRLYREFLSPDADARPRAEPNPGKIDRLFSAANQRRLRGRPGLYMQSRFPSPGREGSLTAQPYSVFEGFTDLFENFDGWLAKTIGGRVHGHLFAPDRVHFAGGETVYNGCLSDNVRLRDYNLDRFLTSLIWNTRGERQCFQFGPQDNQGITWFMARDPNAQISVITGAWALTLFRRSGAFSDLRRETARLQQIQAGYVERLRHHEVRARVRIWSLAEFLENPMENLHTILDEIAPRNRPPVSEAPSLRDLTGFGRFIQDLRNQGMQPTMVGDITLDDRPAVNPGRGRRPHLVK